MDWLISFILISLIVYYVLRWLAPKLLGLWLLRKQRQFADQFGQGKGFTYTWGGPKQNAGGTKSENRKKEGEVRIERTQTAQKKVNRNVGDYVEYEEVTETEYEKN